MDNVKDLLVSINDVEPNIINMIDRYLHKEIFVVLYIEMHHKLIFSVRNTSYKDTRLFGTRELLEDLLEFSFKQNVYPFDQNFINECLEYYDDDPEDERALEFLNDLIKIFGSLENVRKIGQDVSSYKQYINYDYDIRNNLQLFNKTDNDYYKIFVKCIIV